MEEGEALLAPMRRLDTTVFDTVAEIPYAESGTIHNESISATRCWPSLSAQTTGWSGYRPRT